MSKSGSANRSAIGFEGIRRHYPSRNNLCGKCSNTYSVLEMGIESIAVSDLLKRDISKRYKYFFHIYPSN